MRLNQSIESLREMVTTAITVNLSLLTIQDNEVTKRLASYAALIAVPTAIAGVYGMNFKHMPEIEWEHGYPLAISIMAALDFYLFYRFRKSKWLLFSKAIFTTEAQRTQRDNRLESRVSLSH